MKPYPKGLKNLLLTFFTFCSLLSLGQEKPKGTISGFVVDRINQAPIEFCTIAIIKASDSTMVNGALADEKGTFTVTNLKNGEYLLRIEFIGYSKSYFGPVTINSNQNNINTGKIAIESEIKLADEVVITAEKPDMVIEIDKKVYNAEKNITSAGGTAADFLKNIPSVAIDNNGNLTLRGSGQVQIYIDGKATAISEGNAETLLSQIPANNVENVEIITNPGARYDAQGMAGIINIRLKKSKKEELNGSASVGIGTRDKYNGSLSVNYTKNKWSFSTNYSYRYNPVFYKTTTAMQFSSPDTSYNRNQGSYGTSKLTANSGRLGIDYSYNKYNTTSFSGLYSYSTNPFPEDINYNFSQADNTPIYNVQRDNYSNSYISNTELGLSHRKTYNTPGKELYVAGSYSYVNNRSFGDFSQKRYNLDGSDANADYRQHLDGLIKTTVSSVQADFVQPLNENTRFETGVKGTSRIISNDYRLHTNPILNGFPGIDDIFKYNDEVAAAYAQVNQKYSNLSYQLGLRGEQTWSNTSLQTSNYKYSYNYFNLFPSGTFSYKQNDKNELQLSISRRINRPRSQPLNPYLDWLDYPYNIRMGNPELKPELIYNYELGYLLTKDKTTFTATAYYRQINNSIQYFRVVDSLGNTNLTFRNFDKAYNYGLELISKSNLAKWWDLTTTLNLYQTNLKGADIQGDFTRSAFSWNVKMISNMKLPYDIAFQTIANYQAPSISAQGTIKAIYGIDVALKRDFLKKKQLVVAVNISDIFNIREFRMDSSNPEFNQVAYRKRESRIAMLVVTYKFGRGEAPKKKALKSDTGNDSGGDMY